MTTGLSHIKTIPTRFIVVEYDISAKKPAARSDMLRKLRKHAAEPRTMSVYIAPYSPELMEDLKQLKAVNKHDVDYRILTPSFPEDEALAVYSDYEQTFAHRFKELKEKVIAIDEMLVTDKMPTDAKEIKRLVKMGVLIKDKEKDEFVVPSTEQILQRLRTAEVYYRDAETALNKRVVRDKDEALQNVFAQFQEELKWIDSHIQKQHGSLNARKVREGKKTPNAS